MSESKQRHDCLTVWLIFMLIGNLAATLTNIWNGSMVIQNLQTMPSPTMVILGVLSIFNLICVIALFKWKKWGFWGLIASSIVTLFINLSIGMGIGPSLLGLCGVVFLIVILNIGKEDKGWPQLY